MTAPDLSGFQFEGKIHSIGTRLVILWFSRLDRKPGVWRQVQLTLVGSRLISANVEIGSSFPPIVSCVISQKQTPNGDRTVISIAFEAGNLDFECEQLICSEFFRNIRVARE